MLGSAPSMEKTTRKLILGLVFLFSRAPACRAADRPGRHLERRLRSGSELAHRPLFRRRGSVVRGGDHPSAADPVVADPVAQGKYAARFEVKYGDLFSYYSDSRSLMTGPPALWENEGNERWYRWQALWPAGLGRLISQMGPALGSVRALVAGSLVEWHHDANGGVEHGSAPLYIRKWR